MLDYGMGALTPTTIYIHKMSSRDAYGKTSYASPAVSYVARVQTEQRAVLTADGGENVKSSNVWIVGDQDITTDDKLELSDGSNPVILDVEKMPDMLGQIVYTKLVCGSSGFFRRAKGM